MEILLEHIGKGFIAMLIISMPCVLAAAGIGLIVGIIQAVTQVQEQTIAAAPKIVGVFLLLMVMGNTFTKILTDYFYESANLAFNVVPHQDNFVIPSDSSSNKSKFFEAEQKSYGKVKKPNVDEIMKNPGKVPYANHAEKSSIIRSGQEPISRPDLGEIRKIDGR